MYKCIRHSQSIHKSENEQFICFYITVLLGLCSSQINDKIEITNGARKVYNIGIAFLKKPEKISSVFKYRK